jgi:hypothetical protein
MRLNKTNKKQNKTKYTRKNAVHVLEKRNKKHSLIALERKQLMKKD